MVEKTKHTISSTKILFFSKNPLLTTVVFCSSMIIDDQTLYFWIERSF